MAQWPKGFAGRMHSNVKSGDTVPSLTVVPAITAPLLKLASVMSDCVVSIDHSNIDRGWGAQQHMVKTWPIDFVDDTTRRINI
jgi:hypothetical protein